MNKYLFLVTALISINFLKAYDNFSVDALSNASLGYTLMLAGALTTVSTHIINDKSSLHYYGSATSIIGLIIFLNASSTLEAQNLRKRTI